MIDPSVIVDKSGKSAICVGNRFWRYLNLLPKWQFRRIKNPAASGRGIEADLLPNPRFGLQALELRRRAAGNMSPTRFKLKAIGFIIQKALLNIKPQAVFDKRLGRGGLVTYPIPALLAGVMVSECHMHQTIVSFGNPNVM